MHSPLFTLVPTMYVPTYMLGTGCRSLGRLENKSVRLALLVRACVRSPEFLRDHSWTPDEIPPDGCELAKRVAWGFKRKPPLVVANQTVWYFWLVHERPLSRRARTPGSPKGSRDGDPCRSTILRQIASLLAGTMCRGLISTHAGTHTYTHVYVYV